jgi:hypothetical protein
VTTPLLRIDNHHLPFSSLNDSTHVHNVTINLLTPLAAKYFATVHLLEAIAFAESCVPDV